MVLRYLFLFIFSFIGSFAYGNLCDPAWLGSVERNEIKDFLEDKNENDVLQICGEYGNQPLHLALMIESRFFVIRALLEKGADLFAINTLEQTPITIIEERYQFDLIEKDQAREQHQSKLISMRELSRIRRQYEETAMIYRYIISLENKAHRSY